MKAKTLILTLACTITVFSLAACKTSSSAANSSATSANNSVSGKDTDAENVQIPNPWTDCETLEDAAELAGFSLEAPETIDGYSDTFIQTLGKEIIQIIYQNGEESEEFLIIRKGPGSDDISGDYNEYSESNQTTIGKYQVTEKGNDGKIMLATWTDGGYSYSVGTSGMSAEEIAAIIQQLK